MYIFTITYCYTNPLVSNIDLNPPWFGGQGHLLGAGLGFTKSTNNCPTCPTYPINLSMDELCSPVHGLNITKIHIVVLYPDNVPSRPPKNDSPTLNFCTLCYLVSHCAGPLLQQGV